MGGEGGAGGGGGGGVGGGFGVSCSRGFDLLPMENINLGETKECNLF